MDKTAICIVANDNYWQTRYCIENLLHKTNLPVHLYILNNATTDKRLLRFCDSICQAEGGLHIVKDTQVSYATAKNELLSAVKEPYVCFVPANLLLDDYWLDELHYIYDNVSDAGILSIRSKSERVELSAYVFGMKTGEVKMEIAWFTENNSV